MLEIEETIRRWRGGFLSPTSAMLTIEKQIKSTYKENGHANNDPNEQRADIQKET